MTATKTLENRITAAIEDVINQTRAAISQTELCAALDRRFSLDVLQEQFRLVQRGILSFDVMDLTLLNNCN